MRSKRFPKELGTTCWRHVWSVMWVVSLLLSNWSCQWDVALAQTPPESAPVELTITPSTIEGMVDIRLRCDLPSCDAAALHLTFNPAIVQISHLTRGDILTNSGNAIHVLLEVVDNLTGTVELAYVTQDLGAAPFSGTGTLLTFTIERIAKGDPALALVAADVASLAGETVFRYGPLPDSPVASTPTPTATPSLQTVTLHLHTEVTAPDNLTISPVDQTQFTVTHIGQSDDGYVVTVDFVVAMTTPPKPAAVLIHVPDHLPCVVTLTDAETERMLTLKAGDVNGDGVINIQDTAALGLGLGGAGTDLNGDGQSNILDLIHIGRNYGAQVGECEP